LIAVIALPVVPSHKKELPVVVKVGAILITTGSTIPQRVAAVADEKTPLSGGSLYT
jgi:hypothetical protein